MGILRISAKCSDLCWTEYTDKNGNKTNSDSYVPEGIGIDEEGDCGDYVSMEIDMKTGQILNWKPQSDIIIPETIEEDDMDYTVNSNDEDCSSEDSYDVEARFFQEAEEIYRNFNSKKRIDLLQKELVNCEDYIDYNKFAKELQQKNANQILDLEDIKRISCGIKIYKYNLEKYN